MRFSNATRWRRRLRLLALTATLLGCASLPVARGEDSALPWEVWDDPRQLPRLLDAHQSLLHSSRCPDGCRFDRHSAGDSRFIRIDGEEGVIFEDVGPGAITRIWMTMGEAGVSTPLDPNVNLRIYFDGETTPRVDLPLPDFFSGAQAPFLSPLTGDREISSGGNYTYVPMPYRQGCRITLTNAEKIRIWFQVTYHRLRSADGVETFTGSEDLTGLTQRLANPGIDPWPETDPAEIAAGQVSLAPGESSTFYTHEGAGLWTGLRLTVPETAWSDLRLVLVFDGRGTVDLPLRDAFALGRGGPMPDPALPTRSLLAGLDAEERLYLYFPMPYFEGAEARLVYPSRGGNPVEVDYWLRRSARQPFAGSGHFGVQRQSVDSSTAGIDLPLLELAGAGKWVGLFADLASVGTDSRQYLEGDERIYLDGSRHPALYGTGTEDLFSGGFYFDQGPFRLALHGMSYQFPEAGEDVTGAYRLFFTDAVNFGAAIRAGLETGPTGQMAMRSEVISYYYLRRDPTLARRDAFDIADEAASTAHGLTITGSSAFEGLVSAFEGEPIVELEATGLYREQGEVTFQMATAGCLGQPRLRRLLDAGLPGQAAVVRLDGAEAGAFAPIGVNQDRRFREIEIDLAAPLPADVATVEVSYDGGDFPPPLVGSQMTSFRYELWCQRQTLLFDDGFETGDLSAWSSSD